jgi:HEPN domain-containing protein
LEKKASLTEDAAAGRLNKSFLHREYNYMDVETAKEWIKYGDDDLDSAHILKGAYRQHNEIICYHCQQAVEKYLKGFLVSHDITPPKIHVLEHLCAICSEKDAAFDTIALDCAYLSPFATQARYPLEIEITGANVSKALAIAERISRLEQIASLRVVLG